MRLAREECRALWRMVFVDAPLFGRPFVQLNWTLFLLPHELCVPQEWFAALTTVAARVGESRFLLSGADGELGVDLDFDRDDPGDEFVDYMSFDRTYLYGRSLSRGMLCSRDESSMLGGSKTVRG
jgi:hypothetical protein